MADVVPNQIFVTGYGRTRIRDDRDLRDMFKEFGQIQTIAFKGHFAFITFTKESEAEKAIKELHDKVVHGHKMKVEVVDSRRTKKSGPSVDDECFKCKHRGHWARDCNQPEKSRSRTPRKKRYSRSNSKQKHRNRRSRRSYTPSSRSGSYSSSHSRRRTRRRTPSRTRDDRRKRRSSPHRSRRHRRSSSRSSRRSKSASKSRSRHRKDSKSNQSLQRD